MINNDARQGHVFKQRPVLFEGQRNYTLGATEFLILNFQLGLVDAQLFNQMLRSTSSGTARRLGNHGLALLNGFFCTLAQLSQIDLSMIHDVLPR